MIIFNMENNETDRQMTLENRNVDIYPELLTEEELIQFLRISDVSKSNDYHNVIEHLKRFRNLPRIHICNKALYPKKAVLGWIEKETSG